MIFTFWTLPTYHHPYQASYPIFRITSPSPIPISTSNPTSTLQFSTNPLSSFSSTRRVVSWKEEQRDTRSQVCTHQIHPPSTFPILKQYLQSTRQCPNSRTTSPRRVRRHLSTESILLQHVPVLFQNTYNVNTIIHPATIAVAAEEWLNQQVRQCLCKMVLVQAIPIPKLNLTRMFL